MPLRRGEMELWAFQCMPPFFDNINTNVTMANSVIVSYNEPLVSPASVYNEPLVSSASVYNASYIKFCKRAAK